MPHPAGTTPIDVYDGLLTRLSMLEVALRAARAEWHDLSLGNLDRRGVAKLVHRLDGNVIVSEVLELGGARREVDQRQVDPTPKDLRQEHVRVLVLEHVGDERLVVERICSARNRDLISARNRDLI